MRVLVLGANGMLGHRLVRVLAPDFEVWAAVRTPFPSKVLGVPSERMVAGLDAVSASSAADLVSKVRPDAVVNCVGIVKQRAEASAAIPSIEVNALFPHRLREICAEARARLIHLSTDCVFRGDRGGYTEADVPDAADLYGRSKQLGEISAEGCLTMRTSIIGWQIAQSTGLLEWFASRRGQRVDGYRRVRFSGLSTTALSETIAHVLKEGPALWGLRHVSAEPIDKCSLLQRLDAYIGWGTTIEPVDEPVLDRTLDSSLFRAEAGWQPPSWDEMLERLAAERGWYETVS